MKPVPHGEPYAGKLHVRFDEGYPPKTAKHVLRVAEGRAGVPDNKGRPALLYTLQFQESLRVKTENYEHCSYSLVGKIKTELAME